MRLGLGSGSRRAPRLGGGFTLGGFRFAGVSTSRSLARIIDRGGAPSFVAPAVDFCPDSCNHRGGAVIFQILLYVGGHQQTVNAGDVAHLDQRLFGRLVLSAAGMTAAHTQHWTREAGVALLTTLAAGIVGTVVGDVAARLAHRTAAVLQAIAAAQSEAAAVAVSAAAAAVSAAAAVRAAAAGAGTRTGATVAATAIAGYGDDDLLETVRPPGDNFFVICRLSVLRVIVG